MYNSDGWHEQFEKCLNNIPGENEIIRSPEGEEIFVILNLGPTRSPEFEVRADVSRDVSREPHWELTNKREGVRCFLLPNSKKFLTKKFGIREQYPIRSVRVIRQSKSGKSLMVEVSDC